MRDDRDYICYNLLMNVFRDNAYASIELNTALSACAESDKPYITKLFYGVLERSVYYDYVISSFAKDKPKKPVAVIVKMGYYLLENMSVPEYAAVDNMVKLCKKAGKGGASGFVNSALRKFSAPALPFEGTAYYLSVKHSYPQWLCENLIGDYGYEFVNKLLSYVPDTRTHIRINTGKISPSGFAAKYIGVLNSDGVTSSHDGYYVARKQLDKMDNNDYVVQSESSIAAVNAYLYKLGTIRNALDLCAAPGGKAALVSSLSGAKVTACDIHPHRIQLIRKYATHTNTDLHATLNDATVFRPEWANKFDLVICDVPCSGIGVVGSKPDILFNRSEQDIHELAEIQKKIISTASRYVSTGGRLCYSTCTLLKSENQDVVNGFLAENENFGRVKIKSRADGCEKDEITLFPHIDNCDGFYVAVMQRKF